MYVDIREIRMERSIAWPDKEHNKDYSCFFTVGHFSWTYIKPLQSERGNTHVDPVALRSIHKKVEDSYSKYTQSTFLLREFKDDEWDRVNMFWDEPAPFMMITRVHGISGDQAAIEQAVEESLKEHATFPFTNQNDHCSYLYYRTLDLIDVVIVLKANTIQTLLKVVEKVFSNRAIGDVYSYCCIRPDLVTLPNWPDTMLADDPLDKLPVDTLSLLAIRFAVRDSTRCMDMLNEMKNTWTELFPEGSDKDKPPIRPSFITGNDDISIVAQDMSSQDLCRLYRRFLQQGSPLYSKLCNAISDMTTRMGIYAFDLTTPTNKEQKDSTLPFSTARSFQAKDITQKTSSPLTVFYQDLQNKLPYLTGVTDEERHILVEIIHSLVSISQNNVVYQLCYILKEPLRAVVDKLIAFGSHEWDQDDLDEFLSGFVYLLEHVIRTEGSLVHHPETRPLLFDIPACILEFDLAFTDRCARFLVDRDNIPAKKEFSFLLIPCLCQNITIHDRFNERNDSNQLLYVQIPLSLIYKPHKVACNLLHEVAHHAGESTRLREERGSMLRICAAFLLASEFDMENSVPVVDTLYDDITRLIRKEKCLYLSDFTHEIDICLGQFLSQPSYIEMLLHMYIEDKHPPDSQRVYSWGMKCYHDMTQKNRITILLESMHQVELLFSECYADLVMVSLLGLPSDKYIDLFKEDLKNLRHLSENGELDRRESIATFVVLIERIGLVFCAMSDQEQWLDDIVDDSELANYIRAFAHECAKRSGRRYSNHFVCPPWISVKKDDWCFHPFYILDTIRLYLGDCLHKMLQVNDCNPKSTNELALIRERYEMFAVRQELSSDDFFREIMDYRRRIMLLDT